MSFFVATSEKGTIQEIANFYRRLEWTAALALELEFRVCTPVGNGVLVGCVRRNTADFWARSGATSKSAQGIGGMVPYGFCTFSICVSIASTIQTFMHSKCCCLAVCTSLMVKISYRLVM